MSNIKMHSFRLAILLLACCIGGGLGACDAPTTIDLTSNGYVPASFTCATNDGSYYINYLYWTPQLFDGSSTVPGTFSGENPDPQTITPLTSALLADGRPADSNAARFLFTSTAPYNPAIPIPSTGPSPGRRTCVGSAQRPTNTAPSGDIIDTIYTITTAVDCCKVCTKDRRCVQWFFQAASTTIPVNPCILKSKWQSVVAQVGGSYISAPSAGWGVITTSYQFGTGFQSPSSPVKTLQLNLTLGYDQDCDGTATTRSLAGAATTTLADFPDAPFAAISSINGSSVCGGSAPMKRSYSGSFGFTYNNTVGPIKFTVLVNNATCTPGVADLNAPPAGTDLQLGFNCTSVQLRQGAQDVKITATFSGAGAPTQGRCIGFTTTQAATVGAVDIGADATLTSSPATVCPGAKQIQSTFAFSPSNLGTSALSTRVDNNIQDGTCSAVPGSPSTNASVVVTCTRSGGGSFAEFAQINLDAVLTGTGLCASTTKTVSSFSQLTVPAFTGVSLTSVSSTAACAPAASLAATFSYVGTGVGSASFSAASAPTADCVLDVQGAAAGTMTNVTATCTPVSPWPAATIVVITLTATYNPPSPNPDSCPAGSLTATTRGIIVAAGPIASLTASGTPGSCTSSGQVTASFNYVANNLVSSSSFVAATPGGTCTTDPASFSGPTTGRAITATCNGAFAAGSRVISLSANYSGTGSCSTPATVGANSTVTVENSPVGVLAVGSPAPSVCSDLKQALATFVYSIGGTAASTSLTASASAPGAACTASPASVIGGATNVNVLVSCTASSGFPAGSLTVALSARYTAVASCGGSTATANATTAIVVPATPAVELQVVSNPAKCSPATSVMATFQYNAASIGSTSFTASTTTPGLSCSANPDSLGSIAASTSTNVVVTCTSASNIPPGSVPIRLTASYGAAGSCSASSVVGSTTVSVAGSAGPSITLDGTATTDCYLARSVSKNFRLTNVGSNVLLTATLDGSAAGCSVQPASVNADQVVAVTCNSTGLSVGSHSMALTGTYGAVGACVPAGTTSGTTTFTIGSAPSLSVGNSGVPPPACSTGGLTSYSTTATYSVTGAGSSPVVTVVSATPSAGGGACVGTVTTPGAPIGSVAINCTGTFAATTDVTVALQLSAQAGPACGTVFANGTTGIRVAVSSSCANFCYLTVQPLGATTNCLNGKELLASFRYIAYGTTGRAQLAPRTAPPFASCTVNPPYADGAQPAPGLLVTTRCVWPNGASFAPGANPVTLTATLLTDLASCGGAAPVSVSGTSIVTIPEVKLTQTMVYPLGICSKETNARIAYAYAVQGVAANSIEMFQPKVTTSSPQLVTCKPTVVTYSDGISGTVTIDCAGKFEGPGLNVSLLLAAHPYNCSQDLPVGAASYFIGVGPCDVIGCADAPSGGGAIWESGCAGKLASQTCSGICSMAAGVTGTAVATCTSSGLWTITTPCTPIRNGTALACVNRPSGGFADWSSSCPGTAVGGTCSGVCLPGYAAVGGKPVAQCASDGAFVVTTPCTKNGGSTTPPTWTSQPQDRTVDATTALGTVVIYTNPSAADASGITPTVECTPASGALFPAAQTTTVVCVATNTAGLTATTSFKVTVRPFNTVQCLIQPPQTPANSAWGCNLPVNSGTYCTATCINGATPSNPPLAALCSAGVWSVNSGSCDGGAPQAAYYFVFVGLSQSSLTAANLAEFQAALWEALGRSIPLTAIVPFVPSLSTRAAARRSANQAKALGDAAPVTAASNPNNAVIGVKFLADVGLPSQLQLDAVMRSQATTVTLANSLAQAGSSMAGPASSPNSLGASDSTGNLLNKAVPIVKCPAVLARASADMPTCLNAVELTATFTYTADVTVNGMTTLAAAMPAIANAVCRVSPRTISGPRTTGVTVTATCNRADNTAFPRGSNIIYLTTSTMGGTCAGSAAASAAVPAPYLILGSPDQISQCGPASTNVTLNFPYSVVGGPSVDANSYLFLTPSLSVSDPRITCKPDIRPGTGRNTGVVPVVCSGRFPVSSLDVSLGLSVKQQNCLAMYGVTARAAGKVATRCCPDTSRSGAAYMQGVAGAKCGNETATCEEGSKAMIARGAGSGTLQQGVQAECGSAGTGQVATVTATCSGSNMLFNVTNFKESANVKLRFWVACNKPVGLPGTSSVTSSVCAGWRQLPNAVTVTGNDRQTSTSWAWALASGTCQCGQLWWSVSETSSQYSLPPVGC